MGVVFRGFLDCRLKLTTPIPDPGSKHDTAPIPCPYPPYPYKPKPPLHPSPLGTALHWFPSRSGAKACVWGNSHMQRVPHTHHTSSRRATPATYLCYITHATAYPSTARSALHSATDGDASPELCKSVSNNAIPPFLCLEGSFQTWGQVLWAAGDKRLAPVLTVWTEISVRWTFPKRDIWQSMSVSVAKGFVLKVDH